VTRRLDEEQAAVDAGVLDIPFTLGCEFLSKVCGVLVLDIFDNRVPASIVVDLITISWGINNVQPQTNTIFLDNVRHGLNLGRRSHWLIRSKSSFRVDQVGGEDGVDECRLSKTGLTCRQRVRICAIGDYTLIINGDIY
jgi:hypothetical protein